MTAYQPPKVRATTLGFADLRALGLRDFIEAVIAANAVPTAAPTAAPAATPTGGGATGGLLAPGTYRLRFTESNGLGETTASPFGATLVVAAGNVPRVTFPALKPGNVARNLYIAPASGPETLHTAGIAATTFDLAAASGPVAAPPVANSAALSPFQALTVRQIADSRVLQDAALLLHAYLRGEPIADADIRQRLLDHAAALSVVKQALDEVAALIAANPGTLGVRATPFGSVDVRTFE